MASTTAGEMADRIGILAHDSMGGRDTPSPGLEMAAEWAGTEFERMGLAPGGNDGGYIQRFSLAALADKPARSLAFVLVSGEEKSLLGARHFAGGASIPSEGQVANINADMLSMNWPDSIFVFGGEYSTLGSTLDGVMASHPDLGVAIMENRWPQMPLFRMSDHFAFVQEGTPGIFFFSGLHENLHRPSDEPEAVDAEKAARVARLMFLLGLEVARAPGPPQWTGAGQEMLAELAEGGR